MNSIDEVVESFPLADNEPYRRIEFVPGRQGEAVCTALGLDATEVSADPIEFVISRMAGEQPIVSLRYEAIKHGVPVEALMEVRDILDEGRS